jgi:hypothetical protein
MLGQDMMLHYNTNSTATTGEHVDAHAVKRKHNKKKKIGSYRLEHPIDPG